MALWSGGVYVATILLLTMTSYPVEAGPAHVVCYYSSWAHYRQGLAKYIVEDIPVELCTHLIYAFATLDSKTFLAKPFDPWLDIDLKNYEKFVQLKKKNPKMKILLGLGGWNDSRSTKYSRMVADSGKRRTFVEEVVKLLLHYGFDGLDLDWEYPGYESRQEDKQGFTHWVEDLKTALTPHGLLLTAAVSAGRRNIDRGYDIPKVAKHLDLINLMSYDFHGSWEKVVAHHSPLYPEVGQNPEFCTDFAVNYWIKKGAPAHKLVIGVPLYGRSWTLTGTQNYPGSAATGPGKKSKYVKEKGHMTYYECCLAHQEDGWAKITGDGGPYLTKDDQWVGYDDIDAVTKKAEYALNKGLGGVMVWDTVSDDFNNACGHGPNPLLTAIAKTLRKNALPSMNTFEPPEDPTTPPTEPAPTTTAKVWNGGSFWKPKPAGGNTTPKGGENNSVGGNTKAKESSVFEGGSSQTTKLPYNWLAWSIFSNSPDDIQNSISSSLTSTPFSVTTTSPSTTTSATFQSSSTSKFSSSSALAWFADCRSLGFAPDPTSCNAFYRCTNNYAYRFTCPGGLLWHQDQSSCDWPDAVQCILPFSTPNIDNFRPPKSPFF